MLNSYILITGASSGIGKAFAYRYAQRNENLILVARSKQKLQLMKTELEEKYPIHVLVIEKDLSVEGSANEVYAEICHHDVKVKTLINNAGFAELGKFECCNYELQHQMMMLNMVSLTELTYLFIQEMLKDNEGCIINLSSAAAFTPFPYASAYSATKSYVLFLTESLNYEYRNSNLRILAVCPGATDTNFFQGIPSIVKHKKSPEAVVDAVFSCLKGHKSICSVGGLTKLQAMLDHIVSKSSAAKIVGAASYKTWGKGYQEVLDK